MSFPDRRSVLASGAGAAIAGAAAGLSYAGGRAGSSPSPAAEGGPESSSPAGAGEAVGSGAGTVRFRGVRQAGITTAAQDRMHFVALDVTTRDRAALVAMLRAWTRAAERMTLGAEAAPGGTVGGGPWRVPEDTGEAYGLAPARLTLTIGFGPSLFDGRFGLAGRRPEGLRDLPPFRGDDLDRSRSGGDLCIQACADDPQVAVHAVRNLVRLGLGVVAVRWSQLGFGRTSSTSQSQATPRNLFGFKDGTANIMAQDTAALDRHVWVQPGDVAGQGDWLAGGSYLVARRIRMHIEVWDRTHLREQQDVIGRDKLEGAALGHRGEHDPVDFDRTGTDGQPAILPTSHVFLAHERNLDGIRILRRGYSFTDGSDGLGHLDAGLFFVAFVRDPHRQFVPMQRALAARDALNEYIEHTGSALFGCPPGLSDDPEDHWGRALLG